MKKLFNATITSPLGPLLIVATAQQLLAVWMQDQKYFGHKIDLKSLSGQQNHLTDAASRWLQQYFAGQKPQATALPLNPQGTEFQRQVWQAISQIPYGKVRTYQQLAENLHRPHSARAIGQAVGHNPISIIIPCHRVVGSQGQLTGYAGGLSRKRWLLNHEQK